MYCIKVYAESVNLDILNDPVKRLFPSDNQNEETAESLEQPLQDVVHEALVKHYKVEHIIEICIFFEVTLFEVSQQSLEATTTAPFDKNFYILLQGLKFREWRAGPSIDEHMIDAGFGF